MPEGRLIWARWRPLVIGLGLVVGLFTAAPYIDRPFGLDHGIFAWVADTVLRGGTTYRDAWEVKGPLVHVVFGAAEYLFGMQTWAVRVFDLAATALAVWLLWGLSRRFLPTVEATASCLVFVAWYLGLGYESTAQPDGWAAVMLLGMVSLLESDRLPSTRRALAAGLLVAGCVLVKPTYAVAGSIWVVHLVTLRGVSIELRTKRATALMAGAAVPVAVFGLWLASRGALASYIEIMGYATQVYTAHAPISGDLARFARELAGSPGFAFGWLLAVPGIAVAVRTSRPLGWAMAAWIGTAVVVLVLGGWFYPYHWLPGYPAIALLSMMGARSIVPALVVRLGWPSRYNALGVAAAFIALATTSMVRSAHSSLQWWRAVAGGVPRSRFEVEQFGEDGRHPTSIRAVADYLAARTQPSEPIGYFGFKPALLFYAQRPAPNRFGVTQPLLAGGDNSFRRRYRAEFMEQVTLRPARYIVARDRAKCRHGDDRDPFDCLDRFPDYAAFVGSQYAVDTTIGNFVVYRLLADRQATWD